MIVKDAQTLEQAVELCRTQPIRYSDRFQFSQIETPETLRVKLQHQLDTDDIGIVAPGGDRAFIEDYVQGLRQVRKERRIAEQKAARKWVREHPAQANRIINRLQAAGEI